MNATRTCSGSRWILAALGGLVLAGCSPLKDEFFVSQTEIGAYLRADDASGPEAPVQAQPAIGASARDGHSPSEPQASRALPATAE